MYMNMYGGSHMFVFNLKLKSKRSLLILLIVAIIIVAFVCLIVSVNKSHSVPDTATCDEIGEYSLCAESSQVQCEFLSQLGYEVDKEVSCDVVTIPTEFNSIYTEYNQLQKQIGLDLSKFKGKIAQRIKFNLANTDKKYAVLLIYDGKVIGGHITNGEYGSENQPLI